MASAAYQRERRKRKAEEARAHPETGTMPDAIELEIEEQPPTETMTQSMGDKAKDWYQNMVSGGKPEEPPTQTAKEKPTRSYRKGKFFQSKTEIIVKGLLAFLGMSVPTLAEVHTLDGLTFQLMPTETQATNMIAPLLRIADRHSNIGAINPDAEDAADCALACALYGFEVANNLKLIAYIKFMEEKQREAEAKNSPFSTNLTGNIGIRAY